MIESDAIAGCIELLQACFPNLRVECYVPLGEGWDSVAVLVNDHDVFRFAKRPDVAVRQAREAELLPLLADRLSLPIPRYTHTWTDPAWPGKRIVGYRLIPGEPLIPGRTRPEDHATQAAQLGEFVSALHTAHRSRRGGAATRRAGRRRRKPA